MHVSVCLLKVTAGEFSFRLQGVIFGDMAKTESAVILDYICWLGI